MFISEQSVKKTETGLNKILSEAHDAKFKMLLKTSGDKFIEDDWSVMVLLDNFKKPSGIVLSIKKQEHHE
jgi:hypothetical protein